MFPLFLNVRGRRCLVVGGCPVGVRRSRALVASGADVRVVSLTPAPPEPLVVEWMTESYRSAHLDGMSLVFAAATAEVNRQIVTDARSRGLWVNSASEPGQSDFIIPATGGRGRIRLAVGTGGAAPGLAARIRDLLVESLDPSIEQWVDLVADIRSMAPADCRADLLRRLADPQWLDRIQTDGPESVRRAMWAVVDRERDR